VVSQGSVVIIDFEKDFVTVNFKRAEIVLFVWVVLITKIVVDGDGLHDSRDRFVAESGDACGDDRCADTGAEVVA
jgi:hypothetical protein